jgi:hypothetical protein
MFKTFSSSRSFIDHEKIDQQGIDQRIYEGREYENLPKTARRGRE